MRYHKQATLVIMIAIVLLISCGQTPTTTDHGTLASGSSARGIATRNASLPPSDFAFEFAAGACFTNRLSTFKGSFTQEESTEAAITVPLTLTSTDLNMVYQKMLGIDFFSYPSTFKIEPGPNTSVTVTTPALRYQFLVRHHGQTKQVDWLDEIVAPRTPHADRLRELVDLVTQLIEQQPQVQELPQPKAACA